MDIHLSEDILNEPLVAERPLGLIRPIFMKLRFLTIALLITSFSYAQPAHTWMRTNPGAEGAFRTIEARPTDQIIAGSDLSGAYYSWDFGQTGMSTAKKEVWK